MLSKPAAKGCRMCCLYKTLYPVSAACVKHCQYEYSSLQEKKDNDKQPSPAGISSGFSNGLMSLTGFQVMPGTTVASETSELPRLLPLELGPLFAAAGMPVGLAWLGWRLKSACFGI